MTGTDTGAGKTLLTALLVLHLRETGVHALAMKPVCSGGADDVRLLKDVLNGELTDAEINPFFFPEPVAPLVAQRRHGSFVSRVDVLARIRHLKSRCESLIVEGAGGLLSPLGPDFNSADLIAELGGNVVVAARNRLGVINHTLLTVNALQAIMVKDIRVVLMGCEDSDISSRTNRAVLAEFVAPIKVFGIPFLRGNLTTARALGEKQKIIEKILAQVMDSGRFRPAVDPGGVKNLGRKKQKSVDTGRSDRKLTAL